MTCPSCPFSLKILHCRGRIGRKADCRHHLEHRNFQYFTQASNTQLDRVNLLLFQPSHVTYLDERIDILLHGSPRSVKYTVIFSTTLTAYPRIVPVLQILGNASFLTLYLGGVIFVISGFLIIYTSMAHGLRWNGIQFDHVIFQWTLAQSEACCSWR